MSFMNKDLQVQKASRSALRCVPELRVIWPALLGHLIGYTSFRFTKTFFWGWRGVSNGFGKDTQSRRTRRRKLRIPDAQPLAGPHITGLFRGLV